VFVPGLAIISGLAHATQVPVDEPETPQERIALIESLSRDFDTVIERLETLALGADEDPVGVLTDDARVDVPEAPPPEAQTSLRDDARLEVERAAIRGEAAKHPVLTDLSDDQLHAVVSVASSMLEERFTELQEVLIVYEIVEKPAPARACNHGSDDDYDDDEYYDDGYSSQQCYWACESNRQTCFAFCGSLPNDSLFMSPRDNCESDCWSAMYACERSC
jgi:hypothetical protein